MRPLRGLAEKGKAMTQKTKEGRYAQPGTAALVRTLNTLEQAADADRNLRGSLQVTGRSLCELRWKWTLSTDDADRGGAKKASFAGYAKTAGINRTAVWRDAHAWVLLDADADLNLHSARLLAVMNQDRQAAWTAVSKQEGRQVNALQKDTRWRETVEQVTQAVGVERNRWVEAGEPSGYFNHPKAAVEAAQRLLTGGPAHKPVEAPVAVGEAPGSTSSAKPAPASPAPVSDALTEPEQEPVEEPEPVVLEVLEGGADQPDRGETVTAKGLTDQAVDALEQLAQPLSNLLTGLTENRELKFSAAQVRKVTKAFETAWEVLSNLEHALAEADNGKGKTKTG